LHLALRIAGYACVMDRGSVAQEGSAEQDATISGCCATSRRNCHRILFKRKEQGYGKNG
jgi:hypothetical protein